MWHQGGALPPYTALFPSGSSDANSCAQCSPSLRLLMSKAEASLAHLPPRPVCTGSTGVDSWSKAAGFRQLSSGGRQAEQQPFVLLLFLFVVGVRTG